jgi:hypothetical protein
VIKPALLALATRRHHNIQHNDSITMTCHYAECCVFIAIMLSVVMLKVVILSVVMLKVVILSVVTLEVIMLSVVAPTRHK